MRRGFALVIVMVAGGLARADEPPKPPVAPPAAQPVAPAPVAKPAPPSTPEQAADAVLAAIQAKDESMLKALAAKDDPDPWLVADQLDRRLEFDAGEAFARAIPRVDVEGLPAYVASQRRATADPASRERLARALEALDRGDGAAALDAIGSSVPPNPLDVVGVRLQVARGLALAARSRSSEAGDVLVRAAESAARIGWLAEASRALGRAGRMALRGSDFAAAEAALTRQLALCERRNDKKQAANAIGDLGLVYMCRGQYDEALATLERALSAKEAVGDAVGAAGTLGNIGLVHSSRGDYPKALAAYERSRAAQEASGELVGALRTRLNIGGVEYALGDYAKALKTYEAALVGLEAQGDKGGVAGCLGGIANVQFSSAEYRKALSTYERALAANEAVGDRAEAAGTLSNIGNVYSATGDYVRALSFYDRALAAMESLGDAQGKADVLTNIGHILSRRGDYAAALRHYERALDVNEAIGAKPGVMLNLLASGGVYAAIGDFAKAMSAVERARAGSESIGDKAGVAIALGEIGSIRVAMGDAEGALDALERARAAKEAIGNRAGAARTLCAIGDVYVTLGQLAKAFVAFEHARTSAEALGDRGGAALALGRSGVAQTLLGNHERAFTTLSQALVEDESLGDLVETAQTLGDISYHYYAVGNDADAMTAARRAVALISRSARGLSAEEGSGARSRSSFVYDVGARAAIRTHDAEGASFFIESGRAGALLEGLKARETLWDAAIPESLRFAEAEARAVETRARRALEAATEGGDLSELRARRAELDAARARVADVVSRIQREAKAAATLVYPEVASLGEIRATLRDGDALLVYALLEGGAHALVVTKDAVRMASLGTTKAIEAAVEKLSLDDGSVDFTSDLAALKALAVEPLALSTAIRRVLVSPHGALHRVPFAALMPEMTVAYVPSGTTYRLLRDEAAKRGEGVLAIGDPDYATIVDEKAVEVHRGAHGRLVRLPATRDEAVAVGTVTLLQGQATEAGLRSALTKRDRWRAVHFACHGLVDPERPALSALALTASGEDDGLLTCLDVFRMKLPADLVVLSACETGRGKLVEGEGLVTMARAFMFAGSPRVICSLWKVDDEATRALMTKFYELWNPKDGKPGLETAEALRKAQEFVRSQKKWAHPYYWAAWVLWGGPS